MNCRSIKDHSNFPDPVVCVLISLNIQLIYYLIEIYKQMLLDRQLKFHYHSKNVQFKEGTIEF